MAERSSRLVRSFSFVEKEIKEVIRQPRLILTLIVGPFLILFIFGLGYRPTPPPLDAVLVTPEGSGFSQRMQEVQEALGGGVEFQGTTSDLEEATGRLRDGEVDLVVVAPPDAVRAIQGGQHAEIRILHNRLDPFDRAYIEVLAQTSVDQLNRVILEDAARQVQQETEAIGDPVVDARQSASELVAALEDDDEARAASHQREVALHLARVDDQVGSTTNLIEGVQHEAGSEGDQAALQALDDAREANRRLDPSSPTALEDARALEESLGRLETSLADFNRLRPEVLVQPFLPETTLLAPVEIPLEAFYAPGVVAVLLQHIAVTFAALSLVRDRRLGIMEVFRVSPISTGEIMFGKYLAYLIIGLGVGAVLTALAVFAFGIPMLGPWWMLVVVVVMTILASLALGFVLSSFARTDTQAVQYAMIVLLVTIFFSGFVISLERLHVAATAVSYLVPATAAITSLQDVMFRGVSAPTLPLALLAVYVIAATVIAWVRVRTRMRASQ